MKTVNFSWDETKAKSNLSKHNISFEEAKTVFDDDNARLICDSARKSTKNEAKQYKEFLWEKSMTLAIRLKILMLKK